MQAIHFTLLFLCWSPVVEGRCCQGTPRAISIYHIFSSLSFLSSSISSWLLNLCLSLSFWRTCSPFVICFFISPLLAIFWQCLMSSLDCDIPLVLPISWQYFSLLYFIFTTMLYGAVITLEPFRITISFSTELSFTWLWLTDTVQAQRE